MRVFVLDDMQDRIDAYKQNMKNSEFVIAYDAKTAIDILKEDLKFDLICLDHDLGHRIFVDSNDANTGYQVAWFLAQTDYNGVIIIHSFNPVGAHNMLSILKEKKVSYIPGFWAKAK